MTPFLTDHVGGILDMTPKIQYAVYVESDFVLNVGVFRDNI